MLLKNRRAIVTGGSSGIGAATAKRLAAEGASVCVNYFSVDDEEDATEVVASIESAGGRAIAVRADVGREEEVIHLVQVTTDAFSGLDLLVNNAGIEKEVPLLDMTADDWAAVVTTNLTGAFLCLREAARAMGDGGGVVVNISSVHEHIPWPGYSHYCASKGGLKMLMQTAARELAPAIRVLNVAPGAIITPINADVLDDDEARSALEDEVPLGRLGSAEEVAAAVAWAASDQAGYVTGTTLVVDGGISLYPRFV